MSANIDLSHLYADVPFHQLMELDTSQMNETQLQAYYQTLQKRQADPATRRVVKNQQSKKLTGAPSKVMGMDDL
jgi:hypothetical protein